MAAQTNINQANPLDVFNKHKEWLMDTRKVYSENCMPNYVSMLYFLSLSMKVNKLPKKNEDSINLILQFYIDSNPKRQKELVQCLKYNFQNKNIDKIYLLNERKYTHKELGLDKELQSCANNKELHELLNHKIEQIIIGERLTFKKIFDIVEERKINGYIVIANTDIFFNKSISNLQQCDLNTAKTALTLCRHEFDGTQGLAKCKLFHEGRPDSQDAWIYHSSSNILRKYRDVFDIPMGKAGCDNKLLYLFQIAGYRCCNEANFIKIFHNHNTQVRNYDKKDKVSLPYSCLYPICDGDKSGKGQSFNIVQSNIDFCEYIKNKIKTNKPFIIPRIAGIENELAYHGVMLRNGNAFPANYFDNPIRIMKNNAGIKLEGNPDILRYSRMYLKAFHMCDLYLNWEFWGAVAKPIFNSLNFMHKNFTQQKIWSFALEIFNHIDTCLWTQELKGKRILIVSPFVESIKSKINQRSEIYGVDLFPDCTFLFLKPPQTQGKNPSKPFYEEIDIFMKKVEKIKDEFDIALLSCGGYGNLIAAEIFKLDKTAIYVGGVLQMYFGIYGSRWERERPDILKIYKNKHWSKPTKNERPKGFENVEKSCYW